MKLNRVLVYLAGTCLPLTAAHAQSSVTLYGILDTGFTYVNNTGGSKVVKMDDGVMSGNRWGMTGKEDLGEGLKAVFTLENGFSIDRGTLGQGGLEFGRQAFVGLSGNFGMVTLGRQYDSIYDFMSKYDVSAYATGYAIHQGDFDRMLGDRLSNTVKFSSVDYNGFTFGGLYSFSNVAGSFHDGSGWSIGANYVNGPFRMSAAYVALAKPTLDPYSQIGVFMMLGQTVATRNPVTGTVTDNATSFVVDHKNTLAVGASYKVTEAATLSADFTNTSIKGYGKTSNMNVYEIGGNYHFTPGVQLYGGYQYTTFESHAWNQLSAGVWYFLSKTTNLIFGGDIVKVSSGVNPSIGDSFTPSTTNIQADLRLGIVHRF